MSNLSDIDLDGVDPNAGGQYAPLPAGEYVMQVVESQRKMTKAGNGEYLELQMDILEGEYAGRKYWERLNLWHANDTTRDIAKRKLAGIAHAVGKPTLRDSADLHFLPFIGVMRVTKRKDTGELQNDISFRGLNGDTTATPAARPAPAASAASGAKPWERHKRTA